jgi:hypothetical protein
MIKLDDVDGPLSDIKSMVEIAAELTDEFCTDGAQPGNFQIPTKAIGLTSAATISCDALMSC